MSQNILIIDNTGDDLQSISLALREQYVIRCATSGPQAFSLIEQQVPDLILIEVMIPEMNGHEIYRILRSNHYTCNIPIIFISSDTNSEIQALSSGADDYIIKPLAIATLILRIRNVLQRHQWCQKGKRQVKELEYAHEQLRNEHNFLEALLNTTNNLIFVLDQEGSIVHFNRAAENFTGHLLNEINKYPFLWEKFIPPEQLEGVRKIFVSFMEDKLIQRSKSYWIDRNGVRRLFDWSNSTFINQETGKRYLVAIGSDITEQRLTEHALQETLHEYASLVAMIPSGVYKIRMNKQGEWFFEFVTSQFCKILDLAVGDIYKNAELFLQKIHPEDRKDFITLNQACRSTLTKLEWEGRICKTVNEIRWIHIESLPSVMEDGDILWHGILYDINERKEYEEKLNHIAHYDTLTGIPNRRLLTHRLKRALLRAQRAQTILAVCYLDLDAFKPINDQFGHEAGDRLLIEITKRLQNTIRGGDTIARLGGDEFVLVLADLNYTEECETILQRILMAVNNPVDLGNALVTVSASIGVTFYPLDNSDFDTLLRHADHAMYRAKKIGKNRYYFFQPDSE